MGKSYRVLERSYIGTRMYQPGDIIEDYDEKHGTPGSNLEEIKDEPVEKQAVKTGKVAKGVEED